MDMFSSFLKKDSNNAVKNSKDIPQIAALVGANFCGLLLGISVAWPSPSIPKLLKPEYGITLEEASYLIVIDTLAMMIGSPVFANLADKIGRSSTMFFAPLFFTAFFLVTAFTKNIYVLYIARIFAGLVYGCCFSTVPTYIGEVTTPKIRSKFGHLFMTMVFVGHFTANLIGNFCDIPTMAYVSFVFPAITITTLCFIPESPYYYIMKNNTEKARKSLQILRGTTNVDDEFDAIVAAVRRQMTDSGRFKELFVVPSNRRSFLVCNLVRALQQLSGMASLTVYCQYIFEEAGTHISGGHAAMIFSGMMAVFNVFSNTVCDKVGKRLAMVYSCAGICLALLGMTTYFFLQNYTDVNVTPASWFLVICLIIFVVSFCMGQSNVPTLLLGELFPSNVKPHAVMLLNAMFAIYLASTNKIFPVLMSNFGVCLPFLLYTLSTFAGIFFCYYFIPETKGKTLEEIQVMLKGGKT